VFKEIASKVYATQLDINDNYSNKEATALRYPGNSVGYYADLQSCLSILEYPVGDQRPESGWIKLQTKDQQISCSPLKQIPGTVPDLIGMSLKDAIYLIEKQGLIPIVRGKGVVTEQSLQAGTPAIKGSEIIIQLKNKRS
jgi:cell division protein FtsI (penicillin-binding protein 3)